MQKKLRAHLKKIYKYSLSATAAEKIVTENVIYDFSKNLLKIQGKKYNLSKYKNIYIVGFGKASAALGLAIEKILKAKITDGIIITKYGHSQKLEKIKVCEAGHPLPDENSIKYTKELLALVDKANSDDLVIVLISGGGSALLALPVDESISLDDKQKLTKLLLNCGAEITEINSIRKFISAVKSGKLSQRIAPADSIALIISDVIGDRIDIIASGPTADYFETNAEDCLEILKKYNLLNTTPKSIKNFITKNISKKPLRKCEYKKTDNFLILNNFRVLRAAAEISKKIGYIPLILSSSINGETREIAKMHIAIADEIIKNKQRRKKPICLISGGETTVTVKGSGLGGRNQEFVLAALIEIYKRQLSNIAVASVGTDGTDGPTDAAGAWCCAGDYEKAINVGLNPQKCLDDNDSYNFFKSINNLIITGPTGTNIMDLRMILIK